MIRWRYVLLALIFYAQISFAMDESCGAFFYKNGIAAEFPIVKKRNLWVWNKKVRPEYLWRVEMGFYSQNEFRSNGFGFAINIGAADTKSTTVKKGSIEDLVKFSAKNAFLTRESKEYSDDLKKEKIQYKTIVEAKVVDGESIAIFLIDPEAVNLAKMDRPTHMKLTAILPEKEESYICFPKIEEIK